MSPEAPTVTDADREAARKFYLFSEPLCGATQVLVDDLALFRAQARAEERAQVIAIIGGCKMTEADPIGPLHGAGWNSAVAFVLACLGDTQGTELAFPS